MANFMGPMAPPQAAPPQPAQLDIRTNPSQRAQFKSFMQGMQVQPTTAPIAPMLPAPMPSPMDQVDIFAPVPMANGGVADPYAMEGKIGQSVGPRMVGGTTNVIDASRGSGNNITPSFDDSEDTYNPPQNVLNKIGNAFQLAEDLYTTNRSYNDPDRSLVGLSQYFAPGSFMNTDYVPMGQSPSKLQDAMNFAEGIMGGVQRRGPLGGSFSVKPTMRNDDLGILASYNLSFADGGAVGMRNGGGVTFKSGESFESGRGIAEQQAEREAERDLIEAYKDFGADDFDMSGYEGSSSSTPVVSSGNQQDDDQYDARSKVKSIISAEEADPVIAAMDAAQANFVPGSVPTGSEPLPDMRTEDQKLFDSIMQRDKEIQADVADFMRRNSDVPDSAGDFSGVAPVNFVETPDLGFGFGYTPATLLDLNADPNAISPMEQFAIDQRNAAAAAARSSKDQNIDENLLTSLDLGPNVLDTPDPLGLLMSGDVVYNRGKDNERTLNRLADLENRMGVKKTFGKEGGLSALAEPILSKVTSAGGGAMATNIFDNVVNQGKTPIVAADTNQIVGYVSDGPFGKVYTGRPGYNPFGADGSSYTVEEGTGAYIVTPQVAGGDSDERAPRALQPLPAAPAQPPAAPPPPNMIVRSPDSGTPATPPNVVVPSPRDPVTVNAPRLTAPILTAPSVDPIQSVGLPQSFLDLLASFNRPAPRAMQDGGAVLDQAASNFLEALKVA